MEMEGNTVEDPIGGGAAPILAREPVGSVEGALSWGNGWADPNGDLGNGVDIWRDWRYEKNICNKTRWKELAGIGEMKLRLSMGSGQ